MKRQSLQVVNFKEAVRKARGLVKERIAKGENADEFVELGETDGFRIYVAAGKTIKEEEAVVFHENPRDVFMLLLEGEMEFAFENGGRTTVKKGECFVLPKHLRHSCLFKRTTIAFEAVYEKDL